MNPGMMKKPRPIEGGKQGMMPGGMGKGMMSDGMMPDDAGYTGSDQRCANCANFDGMESCEAGVNGGKCEPMGHCNKFEEGEMQHEEAETEGQEAYEEER